MHHEKKFMSSTDRVEPRVMFDVNKPVFGMEAVELSAGATMTNREIATWLQIGKNSVPRVLHRYGVKTITDQFKCHRYSVHTVLRSILGVIPESIEDLQHVLIPLQKSTFVSQMTGLSGSTISANVCENRGTLPLPIELTVTGQDQAAARGRRWIPIQIEAYLRGDPIPFLAAQNAHREKTRKRGQTDERNVFEAICHSNARVSRKRQR